ncbi:MAG: tRNA pseudouridine(55) synthase TruB [Lachnospiraceae bacterium]|nr:tRNA pseudouridine(55) synthase TruB [Lachnospiraceae bacterium]
MYNGLINVYKEPSFTSMDAVAVLRGILKQKKIGHTGTLDPAAEGVLMVCLGNATKLCTFLEDKDKEYECRMLLGVTTDTEDTTGTVLEKKDVDCNEEEIVEAIKSFLGDIKQIPPMYSALKKDGKKLYELAREGKVIEREARDIKIFRIDIKEINIPYVTFTVHCSKGTYIRSLCRDIGEKLGCGGCMDHLKRIKVSFFEEKDSLKLSEIEALAKEGKIDKFILKTEEVFNDLPSLYVLQESARIIDNGNPLLRTNVKSLVDESRPSDKERYKVYNSQGDFCAVYEYDESKDYFKPYKMFSV